MTKLIIKEIGIVILLLLTVVLLLAIVFYDYFPNNKIVPVEIKAYNMPEDIKKELENAVSGEQNIVRTYYIDSSDLNSYESTKDYNKGKANPFADYTTNTTQSTSDSKSTNNNKNPDESGSNDKEDTQQNVLNANEVYMNTPGKNY